MLASVVHHAPWLRQTLPSTHPIFLTPVFTSGAVENLRKYVQTGNFSNTHTGLNATGVPPHIMQSVAISELQGELQEFKAEVGRMGADLPNKVRDAILASCEVNGAIPLTRESVEGMIGDARNAIVEAVEHLTSNLRGNANGSNGNNGNVQTNYELPGGEVREGYRWWWFDGAFHMVPPGWRLPVCNVTILFSLWLDGSVRENIQPYRFLRGTDMCGQSDTEKKKLRAYLAKARKVMKTIIDKCGMSAKDLQNTASIQRTDLFRDAFTHVTNEAYAKLTDKQKSNKRLADLTYLSIYDALRRAKRVQAVNERDPSDEDLPEGHLDA